MSRHIPLSCIVMLAALACATVSEPCFAWGVGGHQTVGALAQRLIKGSHAATEVRKVLGTGLNLTQASVWADCAKAVNEQTLRYDPGSDRVECHVFETAEGKAMMEDYVKRNLTNCEIASGDEKCHRQYHYTDVSIGRSEYQAGVPGTREDDVVAAIGVAVSVLKATQEPAGCPHPDRPMCFASKREALLLLVHYIGDLHQPLHVGAVYLDAQGHRVEPGPNFDRSTATRGGNNLSVDGSNMHSTWDAVPHSLTSMQITAEWVAKARAVPRTSGNIQEWPTRWASASLVEAQHAFEGVTFGPRSHGKWPAHTPVDYSTRIVPVKEAQLTAGGAHLAQLLQEIWP